MRDVLHQVAPEADLEEVGPEEMMAEALDLDSMDFLNFMIGLHERTGVEIPELDYPQPLRGAPPIWLHTCKGVTGRHGSRSIYTPKIAWSKAKGGYVVPTPSELLRRFRLMAVPGPAAIAAVPADRREVLRRELEPVFAALRDVNEGTAATLAGAEAEGQERRSRAAEEASEIVATARRLTRDARAEAAAVLLDGAADERRDLLVAARQRVEDISDNAERAMQAAVDELVRRVLSLGDAAGSAS
ncbi:MAG: hypothetical protein ABSG39_08265 [Acidimicrobiales bacterium]